jgi:hypothetical protein
MNEERTRMGNVIARGVFDRGRLLLATVALIIGLAGCWAAVASADPFAIQTVDGQITDPSGQPYTQAGGHPYEISAEMVLNHHLDTEPGDPFAAFFEGGQQPDGGYPKDIVTTLPPGLVGNPSALPKCTARELAGGGPVNPLSLGTQPTCPIDSQVGVISLQTSMSNPSGTVWAGTFPLYNVVPRPGVPGSFGFQVMGVPIVLDASVRSDGDYGLTLSSRNIPASVRLWALQATFWGVPADPSHDAQRCDYAAFGLPSDVCPEAPGSPQGPHPAGMAPVAFLRLPTACAPGIGPQATFSVDSWQNPMTMVSASFSWPALTGCDLVPFDPSLTATPIGQARAGAPVGFEFKLHLPQDTNPAGIGEADLRSTRVVLPAGLRVSPSSANGLAACGEAQIGLLGPNFPEPNRIRFSTADPTCPDSSKLGSVRIDTPLLDQPLTGSIYLAAPHQNPFGTLLSVYLVAKGPGVILKLPGAISADSHTGQLTASFDDTPQLPFTDLTLDFDGGPHAALVTPPACGTYTTHATMTSWSGASVDYPSSFMLDHGPDGGACAPQTFSPRFQAGAEDMTAGGDTKLAVLLDRSDRDQELGAVRVDTPGGLLGRISSTTLCSATAAQAGTCGSASKVGTVTVAAGAGADPFWISDGRAYITGPYKGAPFGLSMVVPAIAGPFDLGDVVVRAAIRVDRRTAALSVVTDPLPTILQGIPLDLKDVRVEIDRPHFIVNPTSCAVKRVLGTITSVAGAVAHPSSRFQVGRCGELPFAPRMTLTVGGRGHTRGGASTSLTSTLTQTPGQVNLRVVSVTLPTTLNALLGGALGHACALDAFNAGHCGRAAKAGSAVAVTPLLPHALRGNAYFVKNPHRTLPDLMIALRGQIALDLVGKVGVNPRTNQLTTRFDTIPDAAISRFVLRLSSGGNAALGTTTSLCTSRARRAVASIGFRAQSGKALTVRPRLRIQGCPRRR